MRGRSIASSSASETVSVATTTSGLEVARLLREQSALDASVQAWDGAPIELLDVWGDATEVVLVDATAPSGSPGTIRRYDATSRPVPERLFSLSSHAIGLGEAIETARALGRLPASVIVYGIEGADFSLGVGLTSEVARAARQVADRVAREKTRSASLSAPR